MKRFNHQFNSVIQYLQNQPYHAVDLQQRAHSVPQKVIEGLLEYPKQFYYVFDVTKGDIAYITPNAANVLGYKPSEISINFLWQKVHPDDYQVSIDVITEAFRYCFLHKAVPLQDFFTISYRIKHAQGHYIRLQRHVTVLSQDRNEKMLYYLCACEDITEYKLEGKIDFYTTGNRVKDFQFDLSPYYPQLKNFTNQELTIIKYLHQGKSSVEIAEVLFISRHTVDTHRRNLLKKSNTKSTTELLAFARTQGLL